MTKTRGTIYAVLACAGLAILWTRQHRRDVQKDAAVKSTALKPTDQTKVIVDPRRHTLTMVTRGEDGSIRTRATFLPSSGASVSVGLDKSVLVASRSWGTEISPFVGCALGSDIRARAALGLNLFYWQRWELGGGLLVDSNIRDGRVFAHVGYNVFDNILVSVGYDNRHTAHLLASLKF